MRWRVVWLAVVVLAMAGAWQVRAYQRRNLLREIMTPEGWKQFHEWDCYDRHTDAKKTQACLAEP